MNLYARPDQLEDRISFSAAELGLMLDLLEQASRQVEIDCARRFYTWIGTREQTAESAELLRLDEDLLKITGVTADRNDDQTFGETWAATDYEATPVYSLPFQELRRWAPPRGSYTSWPTQARAVRIAGTWGFGDGRRDAPWDALRDGAESPVALTIGASGRNGQVSAEGIVLPGMTVLAGSEQLTVAATSGLNVTVDRAVNGTTAAAHSGEALSEAAYPSLIRAAVINLAIDAFNQRAGGELTREKTKNYEYERANLSTLATFRDEQYRRMIGRYVRIVL